MKTNVSHLNDTKVELTITLDKDELAAAEQVALTKLAKDIKAPGFRKGKVPASVAVKHVDQQTLAQQTLEDALSKAVAEAFVSEDLQALERPAVDVKKFIPGQELEFTAEAEILPKIKLGEYKKLKTTKAKISVSEAEVDEIINRMHESLAEKKDVKRAAKMDDEVTIDFVGKKDGVAFDGGTAKDYKLKLGSHSFIPGFEEGIVGKNIDEEFDIDLVFPKDYQAKELAGAKVVFTVTLKAIQESALPEINDEFAAKAGPFTSVADLKTDIKRELTAQKEREATEKQKDELVKQLIEVSNVPVPEILLKDQAESIEQDMTQNLAYQGLTLDQYLEDKKIDKKKWLETEVNVAAKKRVQAGLVLAELSKVEKVEATNKELDDQIEAYKKQYGNSPEMTKQLSTPDARRDIANRLLTDKTVELLLELNSK